MSAGLKKSLATTTYTTLREIWGEPGFNIAEVCTDLEVLHDQMSWRMPKESSLRVFNDTPLTMMALAYYDGHVVGTMSMAVLVFSDVIYAVLENVVVDENHRRRGIGRALFEMCLAHARKNQAEWITLRSNNDLEAGHAFYDRLGLYSDEDSTTFELDL